MHRVRIVLLAAAIGAASSLVAVAAPARAAGGPLVSAGSVRVSGLAGVTGADGLTATELPVGKDRDAAEGGAEPPGGPAPAVRAGRVGRAGPEVALTFAGLNHRDNRLAGGGNQFSSEPPDQALCVGPKHVLESVNTVLRVFDKSGAAATPVLTLNEFFGYTPSIDRSTGVFGAFLTDPVCHFDAATGRFFLVVLTLDQDPVSGNFTGRNRLDIAVSRTSDPTGDWKLYKLAVQNDGTDGTPDHRCDTDPAPSDGETNPSACLGDYPHIGADANGVYLTTNEYSFFGSGYNGSQIYAISKRQLVAGADAPATVAFESPKLGPFRSFTVWPATARPGQDARDAGGTEYFLSSTLGDGSETGNTAASEDRIGVWALTNTSSIDSATPRLRLSNRLVRAASYALPPKATQKAGPAPLRDCLNDRAGLSPFGGDCWTLIVGTKPARPEVLSDLDANDTRMQQVVLDRGKLYGALDTAVSVGGEERAGVLWVAVAPSVSGGRVAAEVKDTGYVGLAGNDVTYPAVGVTRSGKVVMAATLTGTDHYPSASYTVLGGDGRPTVRVISEGKGPQDGFTGYAAVVGDPPRPRWGDYGATAIDGDTLWLASESIEQSCTLTEYLSGTIGSCGRTRTALANWGTRVSALRL